MENALVQALLLILLGLVFLVAELFLPTHGVLFLAGAAAIFGGVALSFVHGDSSTGLMTLVVVFVVVPTVWGMAFHVWKRSPMSRRMILRSGSDDDATVATMPVHLELEQLRGQFGRAMSALRPSGLVDFNGRHVDTISEGLMVEPGTWVRCIEVRAGKVVVRPMDPPELAELQDLDLS